MRKRGKESLRKRGQSSYIKGKKKKKKKAELTWKFLIVSFSV